jgi:hypothetical protein
MTSLWTAYSHLPADIVIAAVINLVVEAGIRRVR